MSHTLGQLATIVQGVVKGDENLIIEKLGTLENATASELSFLANAKYQGYLTSTQAGAVLVKTEDLAQLVDNAIIVSNPYLAFAQLSHLFIPKTQSWSSIHESAVIAANTRIAPNACIGPNVVIRSEEHTSELQSPDQLVCRLLLEKKKKKKKKKKKNQKTAKHNTGYIVLYEHRERVV